MLVSLKKNNSLIENDLSNLKSIYNNLYSGDSNELEKSFIVFSVLNLDGNLYYFFDNSNQYYAAAEFIIIDGKVSRFWKIHIDSDGSFNGMSHRKWYSELSLRKAEKETTKEDDEKILEIYIDLITEFKNPGVKAQAKQLKDNWFECSNCEHVWEDQEKGEMLLCPNCRTLQHKE